MQAQQTKVDVISNNLANVNTTGYKASRVAFQDLVYLDVNGGAGQGAAAGAAAGTAGTSGAAVQTPSLVQVGTGVGPAAISRDFSVGALEPTEQPFDLAIDGAGFFRVKLADGTTAYTRTGNFRVDQSKQLVDAAGNIVMGKGGNALTMPDGWVRVSIDAKGNVEAVTSNDTVQQVGQISMATFVNPAGLEAIGGSLYRVSTASGAEKAVDPASQGAGSVRQGFLEGSNVQVVAEMVNLMVAQRAYEISSKAIQSSDEMMAMANNLRR